jgi:hypothetical protein
MRTLIILSPFSGYGVGRATDIASNHIRRGRISREDGLKLIKLSERFPKTSIGRPIEEVLGYFDITVEEFVKQCDAWTNYDIFSKEKDRDGTPHFINDQDNIHLRVNRPAN